ncbi:MAG: N,N-dimethylformamidase beta subunit family domain-containing protein, partial [Acidimicrobiales bacterium]
DFFGNEYPIVAMLERRGVDVAYWTDIDLHRRSHLLSNHAVLVSLGHDEYWSPAMRYGAEGALQSGLNLAILGANCCYRRIRLDPSPTGEDRRQVCYKDGPEDPLYGKDNAIVTANWNEPPDPRPESSLIGIMYQAYLGSGDMKIVQPDHFAFSGTGLKKGDTIPGIIGSEFDRYVPGAASPSNVEILCHTPTPSVLGELTTDMSWYTTEKGGGVFATGTAAWVDRLWDNNGPLPKPFAPGPIPWVTPAVTRITENVLAVLSRGPASVHNKSVANWRSYYEAAGNTPPPVDAATA